MDHSEASEALWELYDGELEPRRRGEVEAHVARCADCRRDLDAWRATAKAFFARPAAPSLVSTEAFVARFMGRLEAANPTPFWSRIMVREWLVPALAGLAAASLLAVPILRGVPDPAETMILQQKGGEHFLSFINGSAPSTHDEVLAFVQGER